MIQAAYASPSSERDMVIFFRNNHWYRYDFQKGKVIEKFPKSKFFSQIPVHFDAVLEGRLNRKGKLYFFNNKEYYRYDQFKTKIDPGYPKSIKSVWGVDAHEVSCSLNTSGNKAYLFHGESYTRFDFSTNKKDSGYPKKIKDHWKGVPSHPDAAFRGMGSRSNKVYFFKNQEYYRYDTNRRRVDSGYPKPIHLNFKGLIERKEVKRVMTHPILTKLNNTHVNRQFGAQEKLNRSTEHLKVSGKIILPYITGTIVDMCLHPDQNLYCLVNNDHKKQFQIVKINEVGERDRSFADDGIFTFSFTKEKEIRKLQPIGIDVSIDGTIVAGMNVVHNIQIVKDKNLTSYAFQKINNDGRALGGVQWPIQAEKLEMLHDIKIDASNTVYCTGIVSKGLFKKFEDFIHFFPETSSRKILSERPISTNFDGVQITESNPTFSKKTICLGKDLFQRIYVAQDAESKKIAIWRLSDNGVIDTTFTKILIDKPAHNNHNQAPVFFSFTINKGTLNYAIGSVINSVTFNLQGRIEEQSVIGPKTPLAHKELIITEGNGSINIVQNENFTDAISIAYEPFDLTPNTSLTRFVNQSIIATTAQRTLGGSWNNNVTPDFSPALHGFKFSNANFPGVFMELFNTSHGAEAIRAGFSGTWSLCGGMAQAAGDFYYHKMHISDIVNAPNTGSDLMEYIIKRQVDSFKAGVKKNGFFWNLGTAFQGANDLIGSFVFKATPDQTFWRILKSTYPTGANFYAFWAFDERQYGHKEWRKIVSYREWPKIKAVIDTYGFAQIGLNYALRKDGGEISDNHQVIATGYRTKNNGDLIEMDIYDPNYPGVEDLKIVVSQLMVNTVHLIGSPGSKKMFGYAFEQKTSDLSLNKPVHGVFLIPTKPQKPNF